MLSEKGQTFLGTLRLADRFTYGSQFWGALGLQRTFVFKIPLWFSTAVLPSALLWLGDPQNYCGDRRSDIDQPLCLFKTKHGRRASRAPCSVEHTIAAAVTLFGYTVSLCGSIFWVMLALCRWPILGPDSACLEGGLFSVKLLEVLMYSITEFGSGLF